MLIQRIITALVLGSAVTAAVLWLPTWFAGLILGVIFLAGAWEWAGLARLHDALRVLYVLLFLALMLSGPWWVLRSDVMAAAVGVAVLWWLVALAVVLTFPRKLPLAAVGVAGFAALLPAWASLTYLHGSSPKGPGLTMTVLAVVWAADVGAYFTGRAFGRVKLAPNVSPGKTWEGVCGGLALAAAVAAVAGYLLETRIGALVLIGVATALVSVLGDLTVSVCKRNVGVKDSGRLLPGHGGVMDRIDSLSAAAPMFLLAMASAGMLA
ncbi:MAG TPA: phosphatidate cytidylyltransferase [Gammaproteobacteria bacterium]|nr:phosphatidate cytidylyltransferase [Gammaproteobacteria bacterium]